jgi:hypothetical protein
MIPTPSPGSAQPARGAVPGRTGPWLLAAVGLAVLALACTSGAAPRSGSDGASVLGSGLATPERDGAASPKPGVDTAASRPPLATPVTTIPAPHATSAASPTPAPAGSSGRLAQALAWAPPGTREIAFTDWAALRAAVGADDVTSASPLRDKLPLMRATSGREAIASGFAVSFLREHASDWGWDSFDLDWEARFSDGGPPLYLLRFRDGTDLRRVAARFDARGFRSALVGGATLRSHLLSPDAGWLGTTEFAILNTAFLADGRTLLLSSDGDQVRAALGSLASPRPVPPQLARLASALDGSTAALLVMGTDACLGYDPERLPLLEADVARRLRRELDEAGPLGAYAAHGVGYSRAWPTIGRFAFVYDDPAAAAADLAGRRLLATGGTSVLTGQPYEETAFRVERATAADGLLELSVDPTADRPGRLFAMLAARDLTFGACRE